MISLSKYKYTTSQAIAKENEYNHRWDAYKH